MSPCLAAPIGDDEFSAMMENVGPFETAPRLAVAVSGGGDSMALVILVDRLVRAGSGAFAGGKVIALTVDHGLRKGSFAEAEKVGQWMSGRGIEHHILKWHGDKPGSGIQAAARDARYRIMSEWAAAAGVLHLLTAHHIDDQAETFLMRLARGSGVDGLSGMAAVTETSSVRLLRPLLGVGRNRLEQTLKLHNQEWLEDPSNNNRAFARVRIRNILPRLERSGISSLRLAGDARCMAMLRQVLENAVSDLLASCCRIYPCGYCEIAGDVFASAPAEVSRRSLSRILTCVGGGYYSPRRDKLDRLHRHIVNGKLKSSRTLAGCSIQPMNNGPGEYGNFLVCREGRGMPSPVIARAGMRIVWDNRFIIGFTPTDKDDGYTQEPVMLRRLGADGWSEIVGECPDLRENRLPRPVRLGLPALSDEDGILAVPHLDYRRRGGNYRDIDFAYVEYRPVNSLSGQGFFLA